MGVLVLFRGCRSASSFLVRAFFRFRHPPRNTRCRIAEWVNAGGPRALSHHAGVATAKADAVVVHALLYPRTALGRGTGDLSLHGLGRRPRKADCSAKLRGTADEMSLRERLRFNAGATGACASGPMAPSAGRCSAPAAVVEFALSVVLAAAGLGSSSRERADLVASGRERFWRAAGASGVGCASNATDTLGSRAASVAGKRMSRPAVHQTSRPTKCKPPTTKPALAWLNRRWMLTRAYWGVP